MTFLPQYIYIDCNTYKTDRSIGVFKKNDVKLVTEYNDDHKEIISEIKEAVAHEKEKYGEKVVIELYDHDGLTL